jgi:hypothetical protein
LEVDSSQKRLCREQKNMNLSSLFTDVDILINGKPVKKYAHQGKIFIEAKEGSEYAIKVRNGTWSQLLTVASVDGINVLDGKAAGVSQAGYVLYGHNSYEIKGFRTSNESVNAFKFAKKDKSYAAKSDETAGDTSNCGVIGVQFFSEKEKPKPIVIEKHVFHPVNPPSYWGTPWYGCERTYGTSTSNTMLGAGELRGRGMSSGPLTTQSLMFCATQSNEAEVCDSFDLGTEFSKKEISDKVRDVEFETGALYTTFEIYYASRESLLALGVPLEKTAQVSFPNAFPNKFCKPPRD